MADAGEDIFMKHFKALKRKCPPADLTSVLDLDNPGSFTNKVCFVLDSLGYSTNNNYYC